MICFKILLAWSLGPRCFGLGDFSVAVLVLNIGSGVVVGSLFLVGGHALLLCDRLDFSVILLLKADDIKSLCRIMRTFDLQQSFASAVLV